MKWNKDDTPDPIGAAFDSPALAAATSSPSAPPTSQIGTSPARTARRTFSARFSDPRSRRGSVLGLGASVRLFSPDEISSPSLHRIVSTIPHGSGLGSVRRDREGERAPPRTAGSAVALSFILRPARQPSETRRAPEEDTLCKATRRAEAKRRSLPL